MSEEIKEVETGTTGGAEEVRTFTQEQLDAIVRERLNKERKNYADYEALKEKAGQFDAQTEARQAELQQAQAKADELQTKLDSMTQVEEVRQTRERVAKEIGVPAHLLTATDDDACRAQAQGIFNGDRRADKRTA